MLLPHTHTNYNYYNHYNLIYYNIMIIIIIIKGLLKTLGRDGSVYDLDGSDDFTGVYLSPNSWGCTH